MRAFSSCICANSRIMLTEQYGSQPAHFIVMMVMPCTSEATRDSTTSDPRSARNFIRL